MAALTLLFQIICWLIFLGLAIGAFFLWINAKASAEEEKSYAKGFDHRKGISKQYSEHVEPEEPDPVEALKRYKMPVVDTVRLTEDTAGSPENKKTAPDGAALEDTGVIAIDDPDVDTRE